MSPSFKNPSRLAWVDIFTLGVFFYIPHILASTLRKMMFKFEEPFAINTPLSLVIHVLGSIVMLFVVFPSAIARFIIGSLLTCIATPIVGLVHLICKIITGFNQETIIDEAYPTEMDLTTRETFDQIHTALISLCRVKSNHLGCRILVREAHQFLQVLEVEKYGCSNQWDDRYIETEVDITDATKYRRFFFQRLETWKNLGLIDEIAPGLVNPAFIPQNALPADVTEHQLLPWLGS